MKESHYTLSDLRDDCEGGGEALVKNEGRRERGGEEGMEAGLVGKLPHF